MFLHECLYIHFLIDKSTKLYGFELIPINFFIEPNSKCFVEEINGKQE